MENPQHRPLLDWRLGSVLLVCGVWSALVAISTANGYVLAQQDGREVRLAQLATTRAIDWYSCAVFTPLFVWFARRWPIDGRTWRRRLPLWVLLAVAAAPLKFLIQYAVMGVVLPSNTLMPLARMISFGFVPEVIAFGAMAGVILSVEYHDRWREHELRAAALHRQLAEARLEALAAQLQPHFLFNTLQGISTLLYRDTASADRMLGRLSELLRRTLHSADTQEVTLDREVDTLEHYLEIQRIRFEDRLRVDLQVDGLGDALVPHLILQPLVENAIHHGIARRAGPGTISIAARQQNDRLELRVHDDGGNANGGAPTSNGIGLANTRARLAALYGDAGSMRIDDAASGFTVTMEFPLRRAPEPAPA